MKRIVLITSALILAAIGAACGPSAGNNTNSANSANGGSAAPNSTVTAMGRPAAITEMMKARGEQDAAKPVLKTTTFAENCLAITRTIKSENPSFEKFCDELRKIRYRNGKIDGYPSRIHYFSDWIFENNKRQVVKDISKEIANTNYPLQVNFMSTHPGSYIQLKNDSSLIPLISLQEKEISKREMYFIAEDKIVEFEKLLNDGDIAGITTGIKGLDMVHVVILKRVNGRIHILHASTAANKVILSEETLEEYLKKSKSATGIMVARPL